MDSDETGKASYEGFGVTALYSVPKLKLITWKRQNARRFYKTEHVGTFCENGGAA